MCKAFIANDWALLSTRQTAKKLYDFYLNRKHDIEQPPPIDEVPSYDFLIISSYGSVSVADPCSFIQLYDASSLFDYTLVPLQTMESTYLHRVDDPSLIEKTYTRSQYPFAGFPTLRSHVHPHLVIFNLCDKLKSSPGTALYLSFHTDREVRTTFVDMLSVYRIWMGAHPRRAAGFYVNGPDAASPGFCSSEDPYSEDVDNWDAPIARSRKPASSSPSEDPLAWIDQSEDESLDSLDSGNVERVGWWLHPSAVEKLWLEDMRQWQASSATGHYEYHAPWEEPNACPVFEVCSFCCALVEIHLT